MVWAFMIIVIIGLDQATKWLIFAERVRFENLPIIKDFFYITYCENRGAAFSILQNFRWGFVILTMIAIAVMIRLMITQKHLLLRFSLALLVAGAFGNMIDRALKGFVVDFLHFYPFGYDFAIFNVADMSVNVGAFFLIIYMIFIYKEPSKGKTSGKKEEDLEKDTLIPENSKEPS